MNIHIRILFRIAYLLYTLFYVYETANVIKLIFQNYGCMYSTVHVYYTEELCEALEHDINIAVISLVLMHLLEKLGSITTTYIRNLREIRHKAYYYMR